ncbi:branched-chain amino acid ABC transporter permease, partial [Vibrio sp. 10N.261.48.A2]
PYSLGLVIAAVVGVYAGYRMDLSTEKAEQETTQTGLLIEESGVA